MKRLMFLFILLSYGALAQSPPKAYGPIPSKRQLAWHDIELYGLIHFTPTTFENKEWGYGDADPEIFNPRTFNADQIIKAAKAGGLKAVILVAKHHDGFALWPTKTTGYNISKSPFRNGKGDMVKEIEQAARKNGLRFGIYCSPWDRNNPAYGAPDYLKLYQAQLRELYSNYGELFISWHDGANGGDGYYGGAKEKRSIDNTSYYDWNGTWGNITRKLQPMANIFSDIGWDIRWVGNEDGHAAETSWATFTPLPPVGQNVAVPGQANYPQSPEGIRNGKFWMPAECDVPLRKGWFYHPDEQPKSPEYLFDLYLKSVGRGAGLDLGLAPDTDGKIHQDDVLALKTFGNMLNSTFKNNLARRARIEATHSRGFKYRANLISDANKNTYWATTDHVHEASLSFRFKTLQTFDIISIQEYIPLGQRIEKFTIECYRDGNWEEIYSGTSVGSKRLIKLQTPVQSRLIRFKFKAPVCLALAEIGIYKQGH